MGESQSRYGIIEELNNRKINVKESLANIERETDNKVYENEKKIEKIKQEVGLKEGSYKREFLDWKRQQETTLKLMESEFNRNKENILFVVKDRSSNYEREFQDWKSMNLEAVKGITSELKRYQEVQQRKIDEKKDIINEIEKSINDLKEVSKESVKEK